MKYKDRVELDKEYGLFKFKIPTREEREEALGLTGETIMFKKLISSGINQFYTPISAPNKENNSWLLSHKEFGQTYTEFMRTNAYYQIKTNANIIYLVNLIFYSEEDRENEKKYEEVKEKNPEVVKPTPKYMFKEQKDKMFNDLLIQFCEAYFNDMTIKIEEKEVPIEKIVIRKNPDNDEVIGIQSESLLNCINLRKTKQYCSIYFTTIGLFHNVSSYKEGKVNKYQYYPSNFLNNDTCYEMTNIKNRICLISFNEFCPPIIKKENNTEEEKEILIKAFSYKACIKLILRNISLMFGVSNCIYYSCLLNGNGSLNEFHSHPVELCPICLRKIYRVLLKAGENVNDGKNIRNKMQLYNRFKKLYDILNAIKEESSEKKEQPKENILSNIQKAVNKEANQMNKNILSNVNSIIKSNINKTEEIIIQREKEDKEKEKKKMYKQIYKVFEGEFKWYEKRINYLNTLGNFKDN